MWKECPVSFLGGEKNKRKKENVIWYNKNTISFYQICLESGNMFPKYLLYINIQVKKEY